MDRKRIGTFVLGGLAGVLAGILIAPRSGRELRGSIANRTGEARERGRETVFEARERVAERISERSTRPQPRSHEATLGPSGGHGVARGTADEAERPHLRDVSRDVVPPRGEEPPGDTPEAPRGDEDAQAEELRRKVRETREKLRARLEEPGTGERS